jgi:adenine-specific DNA-methyltransferase
MGFGVKTLDRAAGEEAGANFQILEIKDGVSLFRNPQQTMDKLAKLIPGLQQKVPGVGKFWFGALQDSKLGTVPVYVPNLIDGSEKVLDIPAVNRIINEELQKIRNQYSKSHYLLRGCRRPQGVRKIHQ